VAELAVAMTEAMPGDILAIDGNVGVSETPGAAGGLIDVLAGRTEWYTAVSATRNPRVVLLPAGTRAPTAALPAEGRVRSVIEQFKARFDIVLIDGGSIQNPFATLLARSCDACYVMLTLAQTRQRAVNDTLQRLRQAGGRVSGCILAGAPVFVAHNCWTTATARRSIGESGLANASGWYAGGTHNEKAAECDRF
jgi:Mrp family chromosome partitioning ATPase